MKEKKFIVLIESEEYKFYKSRDFYGNKDWRYEYQYLVDNMLNKYFETYEEAEAYANDYKLSYSLQHGILNADYISIYEYDAENDEILFDNILYGRGYDKEELKEITGLEVR